MDARFRWTFSLIALAVMTLMLYVLYVIAGNVQRPTESTPIALGFDAAIPACAQARVDEVTRDITQGWSVVVATVAAVPVTVSETYADGTLTQGDGQTVTVGQTLAGPVIASAPVQAWSGVTPASTAKAGLNVLVLAQIDPDGVQPRTPVAGEPFTYRASFPLTQDRVTVRCDEATAYAVPIATFDRAIG